MSTECNNTHYCAQKSIVRCGVSGLARYFKPWDDHWHVRKVAWDCGMSLEKLSKRVIEDAGDWSLGHVTGALPLSV